MESEDFLPPGTIVERYTIERILGQGGMAVVYQVRHNQLGTPHALKMLTMPVRSVRQRLLQEGRVQAGLRHPNVVAVTDVIDFDDAPGLVMELVGGPSLDQLLERHRLTYEQADIIATGIISGVWAAHGQGLIHRDLKPANVLLEITRGGLVPKVADFGLAKVMEGPAGATQTRSGVTMGTPAYMAPEQIRDAKNVDERADIFSLGCILYDLVCGDRAFQGADTFELFSAVTSGRFTPPRELAPDIPPRFESAILGALHTDVSKRIPDCATLMEVWLGKRVFDSEAADHGEAQKVWGEVLDDASSIVPTTLGSAPPSNSSPDTFYVPGTGGSELLSSPTAEPAPGTVAPFSMAALDEYRSIAPGGSFAPREEASVAGLQARPALSPTSDSSLLSSPGGRVLLLGAPILLLLFGIFVLGLTGVGLLIGSSMLAGPPPVEEVRPLAETIDTLPPAPPTTANAELPRKPHETTPLKPPPQEVIEEPEAEEPVRPGPTLNVVPAQQRSPRETPAIRPVPVSSEPVAAHEPPEPIKVRIPAVPPRLQQAPAPSSLPTPKPVGPPAGLGRIKQRGEGTLYLRIGKEWLKAGDHPPGRYEMRILFTPTNPINTGNVVLKAGHITTVHCAEVLAKCTQRGEPALP